LLRTQTILGCRRSTVTGSQLFLPTGQEHFGEGSRLRGFGGPASEINLFMAGWLAARGWRSFPGEVKPPPVEF